MKATETIRWPGLLARHGHQAPVRRPMSILQLNLGRYCNIKCKHCHVNAGPERVRENMTAEVRARVLEWIDAHRPACVDLTGGAPELIDGFREIVAFCGDRDIHVMDRCNLVCLLEPGQEDLAGFMAHHRVEVVASLPCYSKDNVDRQRGDGVFMGSIEGLRQLNDAGYATGEAPLPLVLIYNPVGAHLPPDQTKLEADYTERLRDDFGITFSKLYCITNMPIARFAVQLYKEGQWDAYWQLLMDNFSADNLDGLMCRDTISVGYDGRVFDCDFNQMLNLPLGRGAHRHLWDLGPDEWGPGASIEFRDHCLGCTAGSGSSCGGQIQ